MKSIRVKISIAIVVCTILISAVAIAINSNASYTSSDKVINPFNAGDIKIEINEDFTTPTQWNGSTYKKEVRIKNIGKSDALIRVALVARWVDGNGEPWAGDTKFVKYNLASNNSGRWVYGGDGYYYYSLKVEPEKLTNKLIESVSADIPIELVDIYKNKKLIVDVNAEAVQCTKEAHRLTWETTNDAIKTMLDSQCKN